MLSLRAYLISGTLSDAQVKGMYIHLIVRKV